jgi:hypothetical protein
MVSQEATDRRSGVDAAAPRRTANWEHVRATVADLGDRWDLEETGCELLCECSRAGCRSRITVRLVDYVEARSNGYDVVASCHEDPLDRVVSRNNGHRIVARAGNQTGQPAVGDWRCRCGHAYRVATRGARLILWPRNSGTGFRREPVGERCVNGCSIDRFGVLYEVMAAAAR